MGIRYLWNKDDSLLWIILFLTQKSLGFIIEEYFRNTSIDKDNESYRWGM